MARSRLARQPASSGRSVAWLFIGAVAAVGLWWLTPSTLPIVPSSSNAVAAAALTAAHPSVASPFGTAQSATEATVTNFDLSAPAGALRGTEMDGDWGVDRSGQLRPSLALRRRFDYFLQRHGEISIAAITADLEQRIRKEIPPEAAAAVLDIWRKYLQLQAIPFKTIANPNDPLSLPPALAERQQARRQILGASLVQAFYGEEEAQLTEQILHPNTAGAATASNSEAPFIERSSLDPSALKRLQEEEATQAQWQAKLDTTRQEITQIQKSPQLSSTQRDEAVRALIHRKYTENERMRVNALLGLYSF